ncbi:MAG TPA: hypothetical protein VFD05_02365 [Bacilli bacterium]|nr:hypothetical protein [Bacilli bacterium]
MKEQRMKILEMLAAGTINAVEAEQLLKAIDDTPSTTVTKHALKNVVVLIDSKEGDNVRINLPLEFVNLLKGNKFNVNFDEYNIDIDAIIDLVNSGVVGELVNIKSSDGDTVLIKVE